ncbi:MAG: hypothetical protein V2A61_08185, partial [Calditrichota bacterium]
TSLNSGRDLVELTLKVIESQTSISHSAGLAERQRLEAQIKTAEQEIDRLVYQLYDLTEREIGIIEGAG